MIEPGTGKGIFTPAAAGAASGLRFLAATLLLARAAAGGDCNHNHVDDAGEIAAGSSPGL